MQPTSSSSYLTTYCTGAAKSTLKKTIGYLLLILIAAMIIPAIPAIPYARTVNAQASQSPSVFLDPATYNATTLNEQFTINIDISNVQNLWGWALNVTWDTNYLTLISKQEGSFLNSQYQTLFTPSPIVDVAGAIATDTYKEAYLSCAIDTFSNGEDNSVSGSGVLASMTFQIMRQTGSTPIALGVVLLEGPNPSIDTTGTAHPQIVPASYFSTSIVSLEIAGAPTANAGEDQTVPVGTPVVFNASQSVSTGTNTNYTWTFTDVTPQTLTGKTATYTFNNPGNYTVTLTVTDSLGTDNSTVIISVTGKPATPTPTATATPNTDSTSTPTTTTTPDSTSAATANTGSFNVPPTITGILVILTVFVLAGSFIWLRKRT